MQERRVTFDAHRAVIDTLEAEARRRGVPLSAVLCEALEEKARSLRSARRARVGVARSADGRRAADVAAEPIAHPPACGD